MLGSQPLEAVLGAGIDNTDHDAVRATIRALADLGMAVLFISPGSKVPVDLRTPRQRNADNAAAQSEAREAGRADWARVKSPAGLALATSDRKVLERYLDRYIQLHSEWREVTGLTAEGDGKTLGDVVAWSKKAADAGDIVMTRPAAVNLAVEVGASGIVVADCDTAAQLDRWYRAAGYDHPHDVAPAPTILTPGHYGDDADPDDPTTWAHSAGGHFWFTVPDRDMPVLPRASSPAGLGALTWGGDDGFAVLWDRRYVLIPPSTRPEGGYQQLGHVTPLPAWLRDVIVGAGEHRVRRAETIRAATDDTGGQAARIDAWAQTVSWASILEPMGWAPTPRVDGCGCAVWTAPGVHASPKSATAHDTGCSAGRYTEVNAPLHIWTDNPPEPFAGWVAERGTKTVSKLQAVAMIDFDGGIGRAMDELGLTPDLGVDPSDIPTARDRDGDFAMPSGVVLPTDVTVTVTDGPDPDAPDIDHGITTAPRSASTQWPADDVCMACRSTDGLFVRDDDGDLWHAADAADAGATGGHRADGQPSDPESASTAAGDEDDEWHTADQTDPDVFDSIYAGLPRIAPFSHWKDTPPPEYVVDGLLEHAGLCCIVGAPGAGKSTVALDIACHIATGKRWQGRVTRKTRVLYLPGEGLAGAIQRLRAWEDAHQLRIDPDREMLIGNGIVQVHASNEAWGDLAAYLVRMQVGVVIFDTFARMATGVDENSATDVGKAVKRFDKLRELAGCGVIVVHHTGKGSPDVARGSSALNGALDSELLVRYATWDVTQLDADGSGRITGKPIEVTTNKQKNAEQLDTPIPLLMVSHPLPPRPGDPPDLTAALITGPGGSVDPMQSDIVLARPTPEPVVETAIRVRAFVDTLTQQGATRAEIALAVRPDAYTRSRNDAAAYWKAHIAQAVDRGLRYGLIETLTGTASGSRYIPSDGTVEGARTAAAADAGTDE